MLPGEVMTAIRDHVDGQIGGQARDPIDAWHYSPWPAELRAASEEHAAPIDSHSYSLALAEITYQGLEGGGWSRDACSGQELHGTARLQVLWRVSMAFTGDAHDEYVRAIDDGQQLIAALLTRPIGARLPITIGLLSTRASVSDARYVEGVTEIEAHFPLYLSTGG
jgi:hypothetical protein